jgi:hypothetical protein
MDFIVSTIDTGGGKMPILRMFLDQAGGRFWDQHGDLDRGRGLEYIKATEF